MIHAPVGKVYRVVLHSDTCCDSAGGRERSEPHLQEREVSGVLHHGDLKVAHHDLTAGVHLLGQVVLEL